VKVLLDTHALLWWLSDSDRLGENAREIIADPAHDLLERFRFNLVHIQRL